MFYAIEDSSRMGSKKRTASQEERQEKIYSYAYKNNLRDLANNFANYMKNEHEDVKMLKDIKEEHVIGFLETKEREGVSSSTLNTYRAEMAKLGRMASNTYNCRIDMSCDDFKPHKVEKIRDKAMKNDHYEKFLKATEDSSSQSRAAIIVCREFGLRVSEVIKIRQEDIKSDKLHIDRSKGGRSRDIEIRKDSQREALSNLIDKGKGDDKILDIKGDSVNKFLREGMEKLGITDYRDSKTGVHSIRKMYAQERYEEELEKGLSHKEAWGNVSEELGHGRDREDLFLAYCPDFQ